MKRLMGAIAINAVIPLIGAALSFYATFPALSLDTAQSSLQSWSGCLVTLATTQGDWTCQSPINFGWLGLASVVTFAAVIVLLVLNRIVSLLLGVHRSVLALGFSIYTFLNLIAAGAIGISQIAILGVSIWLGATWFFDQETTIVLGILAVPGAWLAWVVLGQCLAFFRGPRTYSLARPVSLYEQPRLGLLIREVAKRTKARMPDNVVLGLEPTFFATNAPVQTPYLNHPLRGSTLHLSLSLMNLLSTDELKAVIGHELGHFSGDDTQYSMRFAPALAGLYQTLEQFGGKAPVVTGIVVAPATAILRDFAAIFGGIHGRISRERETRADKMGASAASPEDVAYALLKSSVGGSVWSSVLGTLIGRARKGRFSRNVVRNFADEVNFDVDRSKLPPALQFALGESVRHPTDSHPPTDVRIKRLGLTPEAVLADDRVLAKFFNQKGSVSALDNLAPIEEDLTTLYYHVYQSEWAAQAPKEKDTSEIFLSLMADFLARMVTIDGSVDDREIVTAEEAAAKAFGDFDREGFRERCRNPQDLPELGRMLELANALLTKSGASNLKAMLRKVAEADEKVLDAEKALLDQIDAGLNPEDEPA